MPLHISTPASSFQLESVQHLTFLDVVPSFIAESSMSIDFKVLALCRTNAAYCVINRCLSKPLNNSYA